MSEFKFACPVCGQHMMCDSSQGGTVMDCPTCFQKIVAPQDPGPDSKLILTGTKYTEKKIIAPAVDDPVRVEKPFPALALASLLLAALGAGAAGFYIYSKQAHQIPPGQAKIVIATNAPSARPAVVAPPANDANWSLELGTNAIPDAPVAGRIHGRDFIIEHAVFSNGSLTLRAGAHGQLVFGASINFGGAPAESFSGKTLDILADTNKSARVTLHWKDENGAPQRENFDINYAMRLEFGELANNRLPGKIWLCLPDSEKSYLLGSFNADARKPKPKSPKK